MSERDWGPGTRAVHAGLPEPREGEPFLPGPALASPYHLSGDPADGPIGYNRDGNPTWALYEAALGELEGGEVVLFSAGMAAVASVLLPVLDREGAVVVPADGYPGTRAMAREQLQPRGVEVRAVPTSDDALHAALGGAALVIVETPSNPKLDVVDVAALAEAAHAAGAMLAVDNTVATPLGQLPLDLGADLSITSASKTMTGHSDLTMGFVAARDPARSEALRAWRTRTGAVPGPVEAWLAHRSLATLHLRLDRACTNALALAGLFAEHSSVVEVRYPGLPGDPGHEVARRQMRRFGPVVSFTLESAERAQRFLGAADLVIEATSFGGVHTTAERRGRWGTDDVAEGLIRLSAGCEDTPDLLDDVEQALRA